jgi:hypothetical protein
VRARNVIFKNIDKEMQGELGDKKTYFRWLGTYSRAVIVVTDLLTVLVCAMIINIIFSWI